MGNDSPNIEISKNVLMQKPLGPHYLIYWTEWNWKNI